MMQHTELELFEAAPLLLPFVVQKDNPAKLKAVLGLEVLGPPVILAPEKGWPVAGVRALQQILDVAHTALVLLCQIALQVLDVALPDALDALDYEWFDDIEVGYVDVVVDQILDEVVLEIFHFTLISI